ncbi:hypothetical protein TruAng_005009 [Truncatella angustata]|nr:hypothetical protein TruAng_005009 [Truncatella angustata]
MTIPILMPRTHVLNFGNSQYDEIQRRLEDRYTSGAGADAIPSPHIPDAIDTPIVTAIEIIPAANKSLQIHT